MHDLMSKARKLVNRRAGAAAILIVPLALTVPAAADSVFAYNDQSDPLGTGDASFISRTASGGIYFGSILGSTGMPDGSVHLTGNTGQPDQPAFPVPGFLPATLAVNNMSAPGDLQNGLPILQFHWSGTIADPSIPLYLNYSVPLKALTDQLSSFGDVKWVLQAAVNDANGNTIASSDSSGDAFTNGSSETLTGTNILLTNDYAPTFGPGNQSDNWYVDLVFQWNTPFSYDFTQQANIAGNPSDELSVTPTISLSTSEASAVNPVPLPPAVWSAGLLLAIAGVVHSGKRLAFRHAAKRNLDSL